MENSSRSQQIILLDSLQENLNNNNYSELRVLFNKLSNGKITYDNFKENLYLKQLNFECFKANDLIFLRSNSENNEFVNEHYQEYLDCIDELFQKDDGKLNIEFHNLLNKAVPTIKNLCRAQDIECYTYNETNISEFVNRFRPEMGSFYVHPQTRITCKNINGLILEKFPEPISAARSTSEPEIDRSFQKLWTTLNPEFHKDRLDKGFELSKLVVYKHINWRFSKRVPDFLSLQDTRELTKLEVSGKSITFTGRNHQLKEKLFFEVDANSYKYPKIIGNLIRNFTNTLFWNAENLLRTKHNLPKIGEGWLSEMRMFELVLTVYQDAVHQFSPNWLKPQHYDVFIPSENIAFEYQGKQHYEPVDFFGSLEGYQNNLKRDEIKYEKSIKHKVKLIYWRFDEPITFATLEEKLRI